MAVTGSHDGLHPLLSRCQGGVQITAKCAQSLLHPLSWYKLCLSWKPRAMCSTAQGELYGDRTAGFHGYSHLTGGFDGGQAEYARVPFGENQSPWLCYQNQVKLQAPYACPHDLTHTDPFKVGAGSIGAVLRPVLLLDFASGSTLCTSDSLLVQLRTTWIDMLSLQVI